MYLILLKQVGDTDFPLKICAYHLFSSVTYAPSLSYVITLSSPK